MGRHRGLRVAVSVVSALGLGLASAAGVVAQSGVGALFPDAQLEPPAWVTPGTRVTFYAAGPRSPTPPGSGRRTRTGAGWTRAPGSATARSTRRPPRGRASSGPTWWGPRARASVCDGCSTASTAWRAGSSAASPAGHRSRGCRRGDLGPPPAARSPARDRRRRAEDPAWSIRCRGHDIPGHRRREPGPGRLAVLDLRHPERPAAVGDHAHTGPALARLAEGQAPPAANPQITLIRILDVRQRDATALAAEPPAWARPGTQLTLSGGWTFVNPYDPMRPPIVYPAGMDAVFEAGGPTWLEYGIRLLIDSAGIPNLTEATGVAGGNGPYWIDPGVLALATEGQLIDEDPITGERVTIERVGPGPAGEAVTLLSEMPGISSRAMYDVGTGVLLATARPEAASGITLELGLDAMP